MGGGGQSQAVLLKASSRLAPPLPQSQSCSIPCGGTSQLSVTATGSNSGGVLACAEPSENVASVATLCSVHAPKCSSEEPTPVGVPVMSETEGDRDTMPAGFVPRHGVCSFSSIVPKMVRQTASKSCLIPPLSGAGPDGNIWLEKPVVLKTTNSVRHRLASVLAAVLTVGGVACVNPLVGVSSDRSSAARVVASPPSGHCGKKSPAGLAAGVSGGSVETDQTRIPHHSQSEVEVRQTEVCPLAGRCLKQGGHAGSDQPSEGEKEESESVVGSRTGAQRGVESQSSDQSESLCVECDPEEVAQTEAAANIQTELLCVECDPEEVTRTEAVGLLQRVNNRKRMRRFGSVDSHARFCQFIWRRRRQAECRYQDMCGGQWFTSIVGVAGIWPRMVTLRRSEG